MAFDKKNNQEYVQWINTKNLDPEIKDLLVKASDEELHNAFSLELEFGTAGIRGVLGAGPGRFNVYTIMKTTRGYVELLKKKYQATEWNRGVVIGHDNRHNSAKFADLTAKILTSCGINAYLFKDNEMQPTPVVSFATKKLNCLGGIVVTASHNPAIYNGYKIYDEFGSQLMPEDTDVIAKKMNEINNILDWTFTPKLELLKTVSNDVIKAYETMLNNLQFFKNEASSKKKLKIIYSAVNGTGSLYTPKILREQGYEVIEVKEHEFADETFKNVGNPNPEFDPAWNYPNQYALDNDADLILINDPDADRLGVAYLHDHKIVRLNGNEVGALLINWKLSQLKVNNRLPKKPTIYSSFVTSDLGDRIVKEGYDGVVVKTLTGFKWMGNEIKKEKTNGLNFVFAYEESIGYVIDDSTLDKDGIQAAIMMAELAWKAKDYGRDLNDVLEYIYSIYGHYYTYTVNLNFKPEEKDSKIKPLLKELREQGIKSLANVKVVKTEDYLHGLYNMPGQDLLKFYFEDQSWIAVRPSGTEPKLKIYFVVVDQSVEKAKVKQEQFEKELKVLLKIA